MTEYISFFLSFLALGMVARGSSVMVGKDPSSLPVTNHFNILTFKYFRSGALLESCHGGLCVGCSCHLLYFKSLKPLQPKKPFHKEAKSVPKLADASLKFHSRRAVCSGRPPFLNCRAGGTWRRCSSKPPPPPQPASTEDKLSPSGRYLRTPM